jgi:hypothetical protein
MFRDEHCPQTELEINLLCSDSGNGGQRPPLNDPNEVLNARQTRFVEQVT